MKGPGKPWCGACREITRSQTACINCGVRTQEVVVTIPDAPGGTGNAGPGPHHGWRCAACNILWDGGEKYGYACEKHGGHAPVVPDGVREMPSEWPQDTDPEAS